MPKSHGNGELEKSLLAMQQAQTNMLLALTNEAQNQTALLARISELDAETSRRFRRIEKRFTRIDKRLSQVEAILTTLTESFAELPETIHKQFGFQPPKPPTQTE